MLREAVSVEEIKREIRLHEETTFPSRFDFLRCTNGIRPRMLSGLMGTSGSGKSTLMKTIVADAARKEKVLVWLSEETVTEYQIGIYKVPDSRESLGNILFVEEKNLGDYVFKTHDTFLDYFRDLVVESGAKMVFIDNITSSQFYTDDIGPKGQSKSGLFLSKITKELDIGIFYVAHTSKKVVDNQPLLITKEDIRGSQKITILSEYFYILQKFTSNEKIFPIINISKHRHHKLDKKFYLLGFEKESYQFDQSIGFDVVNKIFKKRDQLGKGV